MNGSQVLDYVLLRSMTSCALLLFSAWEANHPFVQYIHIVYTNHLLVDLVAT